MLREQERNGIEPLYEATQRLFVMEQARALSPRRTASGPAVGGGAAGARTSTPPRSGTPPRRAVITSDALGAKIQAAKKGGGE